MVAAKARRRIHTDEVLLEILEREMEEERVAGLKIECPSWAKQVTPARE